MSTAGDLEAPAAAFYDRGGCSGVDPVGLGVSGLTFQDHPYSLNVSDELGVNASVVRSLGGQLNVTLRWQPLPAASRSIPDLHLCILDDAGEVVNRSATTEEPEKVTLPLELVPLNVTGRVVNYSGGPAEYTLTWSAEWIAAIATNPER